MREGLSPCNVVSYPGSSDRLFIGLGKHFQLLCRHFYAIPLWDDLDPSAQGWIPGKELLARNTRKPKQIGDRKGLI